MAHDVRGADADSHAVRHSRSRTGSGPARKRGRRRVKGEPCLSLNPARPAQSATPAGPNDFVVLGAGVAMLIASFLPWYGVNVTGFSATASGWSSGLGAWFPVLLVVAVSGLAAVRVFGNISPTVAAVTLPLIGAGVSAIAAIIIVLRWATFPAGNTLVSSGAKFGLYLGLIIAIGQSVFGFLSVVSTGQRLPWQSSTS